MMRGILLGRRRRGRGSPNNSDFYGSQMSIHFHMDYHNQIKNLSSTIVLLDRFLFIRYSWYALINNLTQIHVRNIAW